MQKVKKAVIPVAGFGTRFLPITKAIPKELLPIVDKPVLQFLVEEAVAAGIEEIVFVVSEGKEAIRNHFSPALPLEKKLEEKGEAKLLAEIRQISNLAKFDFVNQEKMLGDGNAILCAQGKIGEEPFLVLFGDDLIFGEKPAAVQLLEIFEKENASVVGLQEVAKDEVQNYGIAGLKPAPDSDRGNNSFEIEKFVEKPQPLEAPSNLAIVGKYVCTPAIFEILERNPNTSGEIRLIDALSILLKKEKVFGKILKGERFDCGDKFGLWRANLEFGLRHPGISEKAEKYLRAIAAREQKN
ncbi:UTP--glucose-1-phosphate uridylyltransferase [Patescibacteria group bacterium]|nr:UTP--glucose-1-phosphate uridylyltransferase [Patescibacteria group bacterium]